MTKTLCIYHGNCADGFTAAWAVWKRFGDAWDYHAGIYQNPPPDVSGRDVLLVDFSYKRETMKQMARSARSILVLDHHKTAAEDLAESGPQEEAPHVRRIALTGGYDWEQHEQNATVDSAHGVAFCEIYAYFDMDRSGAGIAWDYFHPGKSRHPLVNYVEDRDLWRFALPGSRNIAAFVFSYPYEFAAWDEMARYIEHAQDKAESAGAAIEQKHHKDVAELTKVCRRRMYIGGVEVWAASLPYTLTSDAGHLMAKGEPFAACYWDTPEGRVFSLRSTDEGADVSEVAKIYGGGGHRNASGFRVSYRDLMTDGSPIPPENREAA